jgi:hypothetical protein
MNSSPFPDLDPEDPRFVRLPSGAGEDDTGRGFSLKARLLAFDPEGRVESMGELPELPLTNRQREDILRADDLAERLVDRFLSFGSSFGPGFGSDSGPLDRLLWSASRFAPTARYLGAQDALVKARAGKQGAAASERDCLEIEALRAESEMLQGWRGEISSAERLESLDLNILLLEEQIDSLERELRLRLPLAKIPPPVDTPRALRDRSQGELPV